MTSKKSSFPRLTTLGGIALVFMFLCFARPVVAQEKSPPSGKPAESQGDPSKAAVFKQPKNYMPAELPNFRGLFMLNSKKPAGIFVSYPNDGETTQALLQRIRAAVIPMFVHGELKREATWDFKPVPAHPGDGVESGTAATYTGETQEIQVVSYERVGGVRPFVYGYFAMRSKGKNSGAKFLDAEGKGVKEFDELWQSFGGLKSKANKD
ncbi:MAG TPA: hypothetical protein VGB73_00340 [Pyrinomonadaceae bacterium]|jgi:hypothetical protein